MQDILARFNAGLEAVVNATYEAAEFNNGELALTMEAGLNNFILAIQTNFVYVCKLEKITEDTKATTVVGYVIAGLALFGCAAFLCVLLMIRLLPRRRPENCKIVEL